MLCSISSPLNREKCSVKTGYLLTRDVRKARRVKLVYWMKDESPLTVKISCLGYSLFSFGLENSFLKPYVKSKIL